MHSVFNEKITNKLEHEIVNWSDNHSTNAMLSIAISLKRIADKFELSSKQPIIMSAEEYARYQHKLKEF